jgi:tetratricopeptide (TPR) repeat protein
LYELGKFLWAEFAAPGLIAAAVGVVLGVARRAKPWSFLALLLLPTGPVATFALVLLLQAHQLPGIQVWYLPFFLLSSCFLGLTLFTLAASRRRWLRGLGYAALAAATVAPPLTNFYWNDYRHYYFAEDFGANFLRTIAYGGLNIMFERGSLGTFETAYLKKVEWYRPDHVFVDATGSVYAEYELFAEGRLDERDPIAARRWEQAFEQDLLSLATRRDIYYSIYREDVFAHGFTLEPAGMLYRVALRVRERRPIAPVWSRYVIRGAAEAEAAPQTPRMRWEEWIRDALVKYKTMLARDYFLAGEEEKAFATLEAAAPLAYDMTESLLELGNIYAMNGHYGEALRYYDRALEAYPRHGVGSPAVQYHYAQAWSNKAVAHLHLGDVDGAEAAYRASLEAYPDQPDIRLISRRENLVRAAEALAGEGD